MQEQDEYIMHNNSAETTLYERYGASIFAYVRLHALSREDAEDLTVEVFTAALERANLSRLSDKEQLTWLRKVAHNKLVDTYRHAYRHPSVALEKVAETMYEDERLSPEYLTLRREEYRHLHHIISTLPALQQQILQLRYGHGLRFADIAILLNKREEAVRKLLSRTLSYLRTIYAQPYQARHAQGGHEQ